MLTAASMLVEQAGQRGMDEPTVRDMTSMVLENLGYAVTACASGRRDEEVRDLQIIDTPLVGADVTLTEALEIVAALPEEQREAARQMIPMALAQIDMLDLLRVKSRGISSCACAAIILPWLTWHWPLSCFICLKKSWRPSLTAITACGF